MSGPRILIIGGPRTGKTTFSRIVATKIELPHAAIRHTDELVGVLEWSEASEEIARWILEPGPWVIEGVAAVRGLRKALAAAPDSMLADWVLRLTEPWEPLIAGQRAMTKGHDTIWAGIEAQVERLGSRIAAGASPEIDRLFDQRPQRG